MESVHGTSLIAACGMNCGICMAYLRDKKKCPGCRGTDPGKPLYCVGCKIKHCKSLQSVKPGFCFRCEQFPCARLKHLDKRYRTRYGMSMIENLKNIQTTGVRKFVASEKVRWGCPECGGTICVHRGNCCSCGKKYWEIPKVLG